jgi:hypothetical protein
MGGVGGYMYVMLLYVDGAVRNGFEAGKICYEGYWKGWVPFGAQKSRDFQDPPLPMPRLMDLSASKPLRTVPR